MKYFHINILFGVKLAVIRLIEHGHALDRVDFRPVSSVLERPASAHRRVERTRRDHFFFFTQQYTSEHASFNNRLASFYLAIRWDMWLVFELQTLVSVLLVWFGWNLYRGWLISVPNCLSQVHCRGYLDSKTGKWIYDWSTFFIVAVITFTLHLFYVCWRKFVL